ncbi:hypothetical protein GH810_08910 [Acetobacterium paludosum]|uniref:Uncharacterized protein n=1 Tax=Acetobacterium paludosum TaxID=52693 RepID=A0A923KWG6_9FIRM|nr:hypothetical protein [Acetobacterium paludosum]MBC3888425.1 hypothetical protein [Acetobacterium paludosum]
MPLFAKGCYAENGEDYPYEVETTYQLKYYISSALISIDFIFEPDETIVCRFVNKVQYYRYCVDNLFYFLGLINDRFVYKPNNKDGDLSREKENRVNLNKNNYQFKEDEFIILSNKMPRNIIEHLDERNVKTMMENRGIGGFNVILKDSAPNMVATIKANSKFYPYNLDLVNNQVRFYNIQAKPDDVIQFEIDIFEMRDELRRLEQNVNSFSKFLK